MEKLTRIKPILGTYVSISIAAETTREKLIEVTEAGYKEIYRIHELMSFHEPTSEITKLNLTASKRPIQISDDTLQVINLALELSKTTNGIFDISCANVMVEQKGFLTMDSQFTKKATGMIFNLNQIKSSLPDR